MRRFIRYLYEYENGQRIRNVGFVKVEERDESTSISIHGKGLRLKGDETLKLYIFYMDENVCRGIWQGDIRNVNPALNYRLIFTKEDTGRPEHYSQIEGIILEMPENRKIAAVWNDMEVDVNGMRMWDEETGQEAMPDQERTMEPAVMPDQERTMRPAVMPERERTMEPAVMPDQERTMRPAVMPERERTMRPEGIPDQERTMRPEGMSERERTMRPEGMPERQRAMAEEITPEPEIDTYITPTRPQIQKIDRRDIARLPRCEWRLANNSFLMHGYHNYHHLILTEDGEGFWLGVPGIYHEREAKAAEAFGFPRFLRMDDEDLELGADEKSMNEEFGYWCRKVRRGM